jgi:ketosteroid isomerase-like protein
MIQTRASLGVVSVFLMLACSPSTPAADTAAVATTTPAADPAADQAAVSKAHDVLEGAYRTSDCNAMVSSVASDGVFDPPNTASAKGPDAVRAWCEPMFAQMKTKSLTTSNKQIDVSGDVGVDRGEYDWVLTPAKGGGDVRTVGRYLTIFRRQADGSWKASELIWNSSQPMPRS